MDIGELQKGAYIATMIQAVFSVLIGVATISVLILTLKLNTRSQALAKQSKQADVLADFNARFSRTWEMRANADIKDNPIVFYERFWSLQFDQFDAWRRGFVPEESFAFWANSRYDDWVANKSLGQMGYKDGFRKTVEDWKDSAFLTFMNTLHKSGSTVAIAEASKAGFPKA
jgi:hypothetical protein